MEDLRQYLRASKEYRLEYGLFPLSHRTGEFKSTILKNIGGGGLLFQATEDIPPGRQLVLKIYIPGWRQEGDDIVEAPDRQDEMTLTAIAEVKRSDFDAKNGLWSIGVQFLGRILS